MSTEINHTYTMTKAANGLTRDQYLDANWSDEQLVTEGLMTITSTEVLNTGHHVKPTLRVFGAARNEALKAAYHAASNSATFDLDTAIRDIYINYQRSVDSARRIYYESIPAPARPIIIPSPSSPSVTLSLVTPPPQKSPSK